MPGSDVILPRTNLTKFRVLQNGECDVGAFVGFTSHAVSIQHTFSGRPELSTAYLEVYEPSKGYDIASINGMT